MSKYVIISVKILPGSFVAREIPEGKNTGKQRGIVYGIEFQKKYFIG